MNQKPIAYHAYQELADAYAAHIDTKPHNAYYDRPATLSLLPDLQGLRVFDAGCGPGAYTEQLVIRGATVVACDVSERMLELAAQRLKSVAGRERVKFTLADLTRPLTMFGNDEFDIVTAPLCLDYIADWKSLFLEFHRVLKPGGCFVFSCAHPDFDAEYFNTNDYFSVERVESTWRGFGKHVRMPSYRRSLQELMMPVIETGFHFDSILEPLPNEEFKKSRPGLLREADASPLVLVRARPKTGLIRRL